MPEAAEVVCAPELPHLAALLLVGLEGLVLALPETLWQIVVRVAVEVETILGEELTAVMVRLVL
jgi:hypothetical protein